MGQAGWLGLNPVRPWALGTQRPGRTHPTAAQTPPSLANWSPQALGWQEGARSF